MNIRLIIWYTFIIATSNLSGQDYRYEYRYDVVTNRYVSPLIRRVDNIVYNIDRSVLWEEIRGRCIKISSTNSAVFQWFDKRVEIPVRSHSDPVRNGNFIGSGSGTFIQTYYWVENKNIRLLITNLNSASLTIGEVLSIKAIKSHNKTFEYQGDPIQVWDRGIPVIFEVIKTNRIRVSIVQ